MYNFRASNPHELSFQAGQHIVVAPREVQQTQKLLSTGWALATIDNRTSGLIPINYVQRIAIDSNQTTPDVKPTADENVKSSHEQVTEAGTIDPASFQLLYASDNLDSNLYDA